MINLEGKYEFILAAKSAFGSSYAFDVKVSVTYDVVVYWDKVDRSVAMGDVTPASVNIAVHNHWSGWDDFANIGADLKGWIVVKTKNLGLDDLGITDAEAKEAMEAAEDWRATQESLMPGRI